MTTILGAVVFAAQFICCMAVKHKVLKYLPTLISAGLMSVMVMTATLEAPDPRGFVTLTVMILAGALAAMLHLSITLIYKRMKDSR